MASGNPVTVTIVNRCLGPARITRLVVYVRPAEVGPAIFKLVESGNPVVIIEQNGSRVFQFGGEGRRTFPLGIARIHLRVGENPYEEVFEYSGRPDNATLTITSQPSTSFCSVKTPPNAFTQKALADLEEAQLDVEEAQLDLENAEDPAEIADAERDLADASADLLDALADLTEAEAEVGDPEPEEVIEEAEEDVAEAMEEIEEAEEELKEALAELELAKEALMQNGTGWHNGKKKPTSKDYSKKPTTKDYSKKEKPCESAQEAWARHVKSLYC